VSARRRCAVTPGEDAAGEEEHGRRALRQMPCPCGVSALPRPARIRGPCSAHAIPRAGQLVGLRGGARLERVVPGRPSRVARGEGDETDAALRARGARASIAWHGAAASEELLVLVLLATVPVQGVRRFTALSLRPRATLPVRSCGRAPRFPCAPVAARHASRALLWRERRWIVPHAMDARVPRARKAAPGRAPGGCVNLCNVF